MSPKQNSATKSGGGAIGKKNGKGVL